MSKVLTFSRTFPAYHPKKGQPTGFIEKIYQSIYKGQPSRFFDAKIRDIWLDPFITGEKHHTIRSGNRWKVGDKFSPRVWSGKPYQSKQIIIAPDIEVNKTFDFKIEVDNNYKCILIDDWSFYEENKDFVTQHEALETLAKNDGLSVEDMKAWLKWGKPFKGQIICWNESINY